MLGGVGVDDRQPLLEVAHETDRRLLAGERLGDPLDVLGQRHLAHHLGLDRVGERNRVGDQDGRGERVVLGLADQVGGDVRRRRRCASARIAISVGPASASMPTTPRTSRFAAATYTLPGPVITSTGAMVELVVAVGREGDGLGAADRIDLVDVEQRARGEDRGVRQPAELALRG